MFHRENVYYIGVMKEVIARLSEDSEITVPYGTRVQEIFDREGFGGDPSHCIAALVNNEVTSLSFKIEVNADVAPVFLDSTRGARIYRQSLCFLLAIAVRRLLPDRRLVIGHSLGDGYFFYFDDDRALSPDEIKGIEDEMRSIVEDDLPIIRIVYAYSDALSYLEKTKQEEKLLLLRYRNSQKVAMYECGDFRDIAHGPIAPRTGILKVFELKQYNTGFLLRYPASQDPSVIRPYRDLPVIFSVFQEYKAWGKILDLHCVGKLNELTERGEIGSFIRVAEALHDKKIAEIADRVHSRKSTVKVVLIAGPSSSGKTTFTKKLAIQLRVLGFNPEIISLDNYFVNQDRTPRDENGEPDFESLDALDVAFLNDHLIQLFEGKTVVLPEFDFHSGRRREGGNRLELRDRTILLMEGIHGLNDRLTPLIPREQKFKVYVSALTQLNLDNSNRIPTTDNRLIRRLVRDYQFRGHGAIETLAMWPSVRRGEKMNIFPYQENAEAAFNSALDYELAVLKNQAEPILRGVKPFHKEYSEACRLLEFFENFVPIPEKYVPDDSILREFIGDSIFRY